jgi:hypothetical protein
MNANFQSFIWQYEIPQKTSPAALTHSADQTLFGLAATPMLATAPPSQGAGNARVVSDRKPISGPSFDVCAATMPPDFFELFIAFFKLVVTNCEIYKIFL